MPLAAIGRRAPPGLAASAAVASGVVLVAGGLRALALLPRAGWAWTIAPQLLVGAGIGLALAALTERALAGRAEQIVHGGWTLAARHAGVVLGLLLLAPVLTSALEHSRDEAVRAGAAGCSTAGSRRSTSCASRRTCSSRWTGRGEGRAARRRRRPHGPGGPQRVPGVDHGDGGSARPGGDGRVLGFPSCSRPRSRSPHSFRSRSREESSSEPGPRLFWSHSRR